MRLFPAIGAIILFSTFISAGISWDSDWHYRTELSVFNPGITDLSDIQVPINLSYNPAMQGDFSDLMFTYVNATAESEIPYWIEEKADSQWAYIWLRVPHIAALSNSSLFVYYRGPALNKSNISATFIFGDDFLSDTSANYLYNGTMEFSDGYLRATGPMYLHPLGQQDTTNIIVEAKSNYSEKEADLSYSGVYAFSDSEFDNFLDYAQTAKYGGNNTFNQLCYGDGSNYACNDSVVFTNADFQIISIYATTNSDMSLICHAELKYVANVSRNGNPSNWGEFGYITDTDAWLDWFIVRRYSSVQPTYALGAEEEYSNLSIALNYPANGATTETTSLIMFSYTPISTNYNMLDCSFHAYIPGFTEITIANYSEIVNNSENTFNLTSVPYTTLYWQIECTDEFYLSHGSSLFSENRTLIIAQPAPAPPIVTSGGGGYVAAPAVPAEEPIAIEQEPIAAEPVAEEQAAESVYEPSIAQATSVTGQAILTEGNIVAGLLIVLIALVSAVLFRLGKN